MKKQQKILHFCWGGIDLPQRFQLSFCFPPQKENIENLGFYRKRKFQEFRIMEILAFEALHGQWLGGHCCVEAEKTAKCEGSSKENTSSSGFKVMVLVSKSIHQNDIPIKFIKISDFRRCSCWKWGVWCKNDLKKPHATRDFQHPNEPQELSQRWAPQANLSKGFRSLLFGCSAAPWFLIGFFLLWSFPMFLHC